MLKDILEYKIFSVNGYHLYVYEVVSLCVLFGIAFAVDKAIKRILYRSPKIEKGMQYSLHQISYYLIITITFFFSMKILGVDISPLLMGSSVILVGIGLGLQNLFLDFISGIIILFERSIQVGDILDVDGVMGKVVSIKMRTTLIETNDNRTMIFPNSYLTQNELINYTANNGLNTFTIEVGVAYDSDLELTKKLMIEAALETSEISKNTEPSVRLTDFGDSSLNLTLYFYVESPIGISKIMSDIRENILRKFNENNINIPYPVSTVYLNPKE